MFAATAFVLMILNHLNQSFDPVRIIEMVDVAVDILIGEMSDERAQYCIELHPSIIGR